LRFADAKHYSPILQAIRNSGCPAFTEAAVTGQHARPQTASSAGSVKRPRLIQPRPNTARKPSSKPFTSTVQPLVTSSFANTVQTSANLPTTPTPLSLMTPSQIQSNVENLPLPQSAANQVIDLTHIQDTSGKHPKLTFDHGAPASVGAFIDATPTLPPRRELPFANPFSSSRPSSAYTFSSPQTLAAAGSVNVSQRTMTAPSTAVSASIPPPQTPNSLASAPQLSPINHLTFIQQDISNLAAITSLPEAQRRAVMETSIEAYIRDPHFEDGLELFEGMWQRIGLDMPTKSSRSR
jgi:hypothetical protein